MPAIDSPHELVGDWPVFKSMPPLGDYGRFHTAIISINTDAVPKLYFSIGAARSGKSTYTERWKLGLEMTSLPLTHRVVWNQDNLRLAMGGKRFTRHMEPLVHTLKEYAIKALLLGGYTVFVDGTHTTEESIKGLLRLDLYAEPVLFDTAEDECVRRAYASGQDDLLPVIARHCANIAKIKEEGLDAVMTRLRDEVAAYDEYRWESK